MQQPQLPSRPAHAAAANSSRKRQQQKQKQQQKQQKFLFVEDPGVSAGTSAEEAEEVRVRIRQHVAKSGHRSSVEQREREIMMANQQYMLAAPYMMMLMPPPAIARPLPSRGYDALRAKYQVDLADLAILADLEVGRVVCQLLQDEPGRLAKLLLRTHSARSYLSYLPSRYGSSPCLDDAMRCLAARAAYMLNANSGQSQGQDDSHRLYGKALLSLRHAIENENRYMDTDVLCATQLLSLFEMLNVQEHAWIQHNSGTETLIKIRGPENHRTEFDTVLFKTQAMSIAGEALFRNKLCVFENENWQIFFRDKASREMNRQESLWWSLFASLCCVPNLLIHNSNLLRQPIISLSSYTQRHAALLMRSLELHDTLHAWHTNLEAWPPNPAVPMSCYELPKGPESPELMKIRGMFMYSVMCTNRVLASLLPEGVERTATEAEAQQLADMALSLEEMARQANSSDKFLLAQKNLLANAVAMTKDDWIHDIVTNEDGTPLDWEAKRIALRKRWGRFAGLSWEWLTENKASAEATARKKFIRDRQDS